MKSADNMSLGIVTTESGITGRTAPKTTTKDQKERCFRAPDPSGSSRGPPGAPSGAHEICISAAGVPPNSPGFEISRFRFEGDSVSQERCSRLGESLICFEKSISTKEELSTYSDATFSEYALWLQEYPPLAHNASSLLDNIS